MQRVEGEKRDRTQRSEESPLGETSKRETKHFCTLFAISNESAVMSTKKFFSQVKELV